MYILTMRNSSLLAVSLLAAVVSAANADPRNPRPDWVDGASMEYPRERYITGVGIGDDRATAEERARGEIAKVFSANVSVDTTVNETETNAASAAGSQNAFSQQIAQNIRTVSQKVLEGVQLVESWQDPATRVHYTLAVLERAKAKTGLVEKLGELDRQAAQWREGMDKANDKLPRAKAAMKLLTVLKARNELNSDLRVLDEGGQGLPAPIDEALVRPAAAKAIAALNVVVDLSGSGSEEVETGIMRGLTAFGLQASKPDSKADADIIVEGKIDTKAVPADDKRWQWARSTVTLTLKDARAGKAVSRFDVSDREASANYDEAVRRTYVELAKSVSEKVSQSITAYFENN
jgi:hypothetical protein